MVNTNDKVIVKIDYLPSVNYSMMNSGIEVFNSLVLENSDDKDLYDLSVDINGQYLKDSICRFELLKKGQSVQVTTIKIEPDFAVLSEITEAVKSSFHLVVKSLDEVIFEQDYPITLLSYEEWAGSNVMPEHIAAFVVPNNPLLPKIKLSAAKFLEKWTGSTAFDEYQYALRLLPFMKPCVLKASSILLLLPVLNRQDSASVWQIKC